MAFPVKEIKLTADQVSNGEGFKLIKVLDWYEYENGKKKDRSSGYKYQCVLEGMDFEKIDVKIPFVKGQAPIMSPEDFAEELERIGKKSTLVEFTGFEGMLYIDTNGFAEIKLSCKATDIDVVL